jgi:hypothetical protein
MIVLAAHHRHHVLPTMVAFVAFWASLGFGLYLMFALRGWYRRALAALTALSLAAMSFGLLKAESDTWWNRRCDSDKPGCGEAPPLVPFTVSPSD